MYDAGLEQAKLTTISRCHVISHSRNTKTFLIHFLCATAVVNVVVIVAARASFDLITMNACLFIDSTEIPVRAMVLLYSEQHTERFDRLRKQNEKSVPFSVDLFSVNAKRELTTNEMRARECVVCVLCHHLGFGHRHNVPINIFPYSFSVDGSLCVLFLHNK